MVSHEYSPEEARNTVNACIVVITVFVLDWICNLDEEVEVMARTGLNIPIVVYHSSRTASLAYGTWIALRAAGLVGSDIFRTSIVMWCISTVAATSTSLLFFFRMRAVYSDSRPVMTVFAFVWVLLIITPILGIFGVVKKCGAICQHSNRLALAFDISIFLHDTLVFLCISRKIYGNSLSAVPRSRFGKVRRFFSSQGLHAVSKALLLSGQLYYGVTLGVLVMTVSAQYIGLPYSDAIGAFYITLSSALACRVFRMVLLCRRGGDTAISTRAVEGMIMAAMAGPEAQGAAGASDMGLPISGA
ncbi:hypothetical protein FIBSPDRAFT_933852 [Athelia psychrophila]|uniref:DUF6533 domain-containing protein n=1 Tax=Athelia psychrophila TaxID=1759441 RepID=A0A166GA66_9AGAM|nr:hypothetical protein FIBSPDRAFT_933852 [Fibularhizoctonia sp. CBS 109695]